MTVSELTAQIRATLEPRFERVEVEGEVSNLYHAPSGHLYFTLKDATAMIQAVSFNHRHGVFSEGAQVRASGRVGIYSTRGTYQIICATVTELGGGEILAMLERRKRELAAEGLFDTAHKKPLPYFVRSVALLTSAGGAAIHDFLEVTRRRNDTIDIIVVPSLVQGLEAAGQICDRLRYINHHRLAEVIVMTRGGGSLEDLLPFSEESVVRAVFASEIPVVAAIGHEIDIALCELVADVRASTPSVAAELVSVEKRQLLQRIATARTAAHNSMTERLRYLTTTLAHYRPPRLQQILVRLLRNFAITLDDRKYKLQSAARAMIDGRRNQVQSHRTQLRALSPRAILQRGFAIVQEKESGAVVRDSTTQRVGGALTVQLARGGMNVRVTDLIQSDE